MTKRTKCSVEEVEARGLAILRVESLTLEMADRKEFRRAARTLLGSSMSRPVVDLSGVSRLTSVFIGEIVYLAECARTEDKRLSVIAPKHVAELFEMTGTNEVFSLHIVGEKK